VCRRECSQQSDCNEVIVCASNPEKTRECIKDCTDPEASCESKCASDQECMDKCNACLQKCLEMKECKNAMECAPFWDMDRSDVPEGAPRACILRDRLYRSPVEE
jgi:hypothetical protein